MRDRTNPQIELTLWRHGETAANKERRYLGKTDEGLSEEGKRLAEAAAGQLLQRIAEGKAKPPGKIFVSPMRRCLQSAQLLYPDVPAVVIPEWEEMDFGEFEYKNYEELKSDARYQAWIDSGGTLPFPGGESREQFIVRCKKGYERMRLSIRSDMESVGIVAHGGTLMALLSAYGGGDYFDYQTGCASGFGCVMETDGRLTNICRIGRKRDDEISYGGVCRRIYIGLPVRGSLLASPSDPCDRASDRRDGKKAEEGRESAG